MSIFGSMRTSVSGMNAQANALSAISDNISNSSTTGYKSASTSFSDLVMPSTGGGSYQSGGVQTTTQYSISEQGGLSYTTTSTNLAIKGDGFFVVQDASGNSYLTRDGDFTADSSGNLVNSAGYTLMGYSEEDGDPSVTVNGLSGMTPINVNAGGLQAVATSSGTLGGNLNSTADVGTISKTSLVTYDSQGNEVKYNIEYTKTDANTWDVTAYSDEDPSTAVGTTTLTFDSDGNVSGGGPLSISSTSASTTLSQAFDIDVSSMTQLASTFAPTGSADGQAANSVKNVAIGTDGTVTATYEDGTSKSIARVPLATVASPDKLTVLSGGVYQSNVESGATVTGWPNSGNFGYVQSSALEQSNVDLATQLTDMIQTQKSYTANSKVFQIGSDLMDVIDNLVR